MSPIVKKNRWKFVSLVFPVFLFLLSWFLPASQTPPPPREVARYMEESFGIPGTLVHETWRRFWQKTADPSAVLHRNAVKLAMESSPALPQAQSFVLPDGYQAQNDLTSMIFAQVADGLIPGTNKAYRTVFFLSNLTRSPAQGYIDFFDDQGRPMILGLQGQNASRFPISLGVGELLRLTTSGSGAMKVGWARVSGDQMLSGSGSFHVSDASGKVYSDVGLAASPEGTRYSLFVDSKGIADTGVAFVNPHEAQTLTLRLDLRDTNGISVATQQLILPPLGHQASFFTQIFSAVPGIQEFEGSMIVEGDRSWSGITLRILGDQLTSLPLIAPPDTKNPISQSGFAQVADGLTGPGGLRYATSVILLNPTDQLRQGTMEFFQSDGTPLNLTIQGQVGHSFPFQLQPSGVLRWTSSGSGSVKVGWARVTGEEIRGSLVFHVQNAAGQLLTEAGVPDSQADSSLQWIADTLGWYDTGLALANADAWDTAEITLTLLNRQGTRVANSCLYLGPLQHKAVYLSQLFEGLADIAEFEGRLIVSSSEDLVPLSLRSLDEKLTSAPTLAPRMAFSPDLVLEPAQNLAGTAPPIQIRLHQSGLQLAPQGVKLTAPGLLAQIEGVRAGDYLGYGYYLADAELLARGMIFSGTFSLRATQDGRLDFEALDTRMNTLISGSIENQPEGMVLQLALNEDKPGQSNMGLELDLVLHLFADLIRLPSSAGTVTLASEGRSVLFSETDRRKITRRLTQPLPIVAAATAAAEIRKISALLTAGGQVMRIFGERFDSSSEVLFSGSQGGTIRVPAKILDSNTLEVAIPKVAGNGPIQVKGAGGGSNPFWIRNIFSPQIDMQFLNLNAGAVSGLSLMVEQAGAQFPLGTLQFQMTGVSSSLPGISVGQKVGELRLFGGVYPNLEPYAQREVRGGSSTADEILLDIVNTASNKVESRLRITRMTATPQGLQGNFGYLQTPGQPAIYKYPSRWELHLTGFPFTLPAEVGSPVLTEVLLYSYPTGPGGMSSALKDEVSLAHFTQTGTTPQTIPEMPTTTTTTIFRCNQPPSTLTPSSSSVAATTTSTSSSLRPTTTSSSSTSSSQRITTSTSTLRPSTTVTSSSTTWKPTTTITSTTSSTSLRPATTTTLGGLSCNLFSENFNGTSITGWSFGSSGRWSLTGGRLRVDSISSATYAIAEVELPYANIFSTTRMDVQALGFSATSSLFGFEIYDPLATVGQYVFAGRNVDGFGALVQGDTGRVGLLVYDISANSLYVYDLISYGSVSNIGVELAANQVKLLVNGMVQRTYTATVPAVSMSRLMLVAGGSETIVAYDNICLSSPPLLAQKTGYRVISPPYGVGIRPHGEWRGRNPKPFSSEHLRPGLSDVP